MEIIVHFKSDTKRKGCYKGTNKTDASVYSNIMQ